MPNHLRTGSSSTTTTARHGKTGYVKLHVDIDPKVKDELVAIAERDGVAYAQVVRDGLDFYLDAVRAL